MSDRNAERNPLKRNTLLLLLSAAVLLAIAAATLLLPGSASAPDELPPAQAVDAGDMVRVEEGCELLQTLTYTRCEHVVTRRITAPAELYGKTLDEVAALYPEWRITEFGAKLIKMEQQPDMFCPDHMVLMPNGAGVLCVFQNKYGDACGAGTMAGKRGVLSRARHLYPQPGAGVLRRAGHAADGQAAGGAASAL